MNTVLTPRWLAMEACLCARGYLHSAVDVVLHFPDGTYERGGDGEGHSLREIPVPFNAADVATEPVSVMRDRLRYVVRDGLGLSPMVDCFRFQLDGY